MHFPSLSTLESPEVGIKFRHGLAYSPDGHSLATCSSTAIIIWDTQTGGVAEEVKCGITGDHSELVWSLDGRTIALSLQVSKTLSLYICDVASGAVQSSGTIQSVHNTHLWTHHESFQVMAITGDVVKGRMVNIFDLGSTLTKVKSFTFQSHLSYGAFSPATYRISASASGDGSYNNKIIVLDIQNSKVLLQGIGQYWKHAFSPDGSTLATVARDHLVIWKYTSGNYTQWRNFQQTSMLPQFSPTSSSILGCAGPILNMLHLDYSPISPVAESAITIHSQPLDTFAPNGTYIATTHYQESTIMITNLHSQDPLTSQLIDTGLEILAIALTGNVLLVKGQNTLMAWLLTEEGVVDGICDNRKADHNGCLWKVSLQAQASFWARLRQWENNENKNAVGFSVEGDIVAVNYEDRPIHVYNTRTGGILPSDKAPQHSGYEFQDECKQYHHDLYKLHQPPQCDWPISQTILQEGWVKDPEGKHRLWLHPHWRSSKNDVGWLHNTSTLRIRNHSQLVIVKF